MFGLRKKGPTQSFTHADDCKIVKADPHVSIPWNETRTGHWEARCQCGAEHYDEPVADRRVRLDPLDPGTSQHGGGCEFKDTTDREVIRLVLRVKPGLGPGYVWVECSACDFAWPVPDFADESVG